MDILAYEYLKEGLKEYNERMGKPYNNAVVALPPENPTYPLTVFNEIRNVANSSFNTIYERVASVGYSAHIYAKQRGKHTKQQVAREIAQMVDTYLSSFNLTRISYNAIENVNDSSIYEIIITYSGNLHENKRRFI